MDSTTVSIMVVAFFGGFLLIFHLWPAGKGPTTSHRRERGVKVTIQVPASSHDTPAHSTFAVLAATLGDGRLGTVTLEGLVVTVTDAQQGYVRFTASKAEPMALFDLSVESNSAELTLLACDTAALSVGPMEVVIDGIELFVDGTVPRETLKRDLHDKQMHKAKDLQRAGTQLR